MNTDCDDGTLHVMAAMRGRLEMMMIMILMLLPLRSTVKVEGSLPRSNSF